AFHDERAGDLEQHVSKEEDAGHVTEHDVVEAEVGTHGQRRVAHVHPVEIIDDVENEEKRKQPPEDALPCALSNVWKRNDAGHGTVEGNSLTFVCCSRSRSPRSV